MDGFSFLADRSSSSALHLIVIVIRSANAWLE